jgi:hypothetical protein
MARRQRRRDPAKERRWRRLLQQWRGSRQSVREFCYSQELTEASFYAWRRKLAQRDREAFASPVATKSENGVADPNALAAARRPTFLPVHVVPEIQTMAMGGLSRTDCIEVQLLSGVRLHVPAGCDRRALAEVLAALEARPC